MIRSKALCLILTLGSTTLSFAVEGQNQTFISKKEALKLSSLSNTQTGRKQHIESQKGHYKNFTGRLLGSHVRMRSQADVESDVIRELKKDELVVITGESNEFYEIVPPSDVKAYVFRSFVLDNVVEGNRVNVRLAPDLEATVIGHLNTGDRIQGKISDRNSKWLEIAPPESSKFYVAKEFIEYAGGADLKGIQDKRARELAKLCHDAYYAGDSEMHKPFQDINFERISTLFKHIINDYQDFPHESHRAATKLTALQETYLQKKLEYLESKAQILDQQLATKATQENTQKHEKQTHDVQVVATPTLNPNKVKMWETLEQALFATWQSMHDSTNIADFYDDERENSQTITGMLEPFSEAVKNKPGSHVIRFRDVPIAYVYSTKVDLDQYVGKKVNLVVAQRDNNNFAFPAFFALEVTH